MHKHKDLGFTFTVETDTEIPKDLTELFFLRMSNIDESLLTYYKDIELTKSISEKIPIPVIASGGAGCLRHIKDAFTLGKSSAALLASLLHDGQLTIREIKEYLIKENLPIRPIE